MFRDTVLAVAVGVAAAGHAGETLTLRGGGTGRMAIARDVSAETLAVDIGIVGKRVNGGILRVDGPGCVTVGAGGVRDVTKDGRYCVIAAPLRFAADQVWDCSGREQLYFYGPLSDADAVRPARIVKKGPHALYLGENAAGSPLAASVRVEEGALCFVGRDCLGPKGAITLADEGYLWYGGGSNCRAVTVARDCTSACPLRAEIWGPVSEQSGRVTFETAGKTVRIASDRTLVLSGGVAFREPGVLRLDFGDGATLVLAGKPWAGERTSVTAAGRGAIEFKTDRVWADGTVSLALPPGFVCRLNGTTQRLDRLTVAAGARVVGPGRIETAGGAFDLPEGGALGGVQPKRPPAPDWRKPIDVGNRLQLPWDDYLTDVARTTAEAVQHAPRFAATAHVFDHPWEGDCCFYEVLVREKDCLRIYYKAVGSGLCDIHAKGVFKLHHGSKLAFIESRDGGFSWTTPDLGKIEVSGSKHNNVFHAEDRDNFFVMKDTNPACAPSERYKALSMWGEFNKDGTPDFTRGKPGLWCYVSSNGVDFTRSHLMTDRGAFDSINTAWWDAARGEYHAFVRGYHNVKAERNNDLTVRDIRHMTSKDFRTWTTPEMLDFGEGAEDYPLYTNVIQPYYRDPSVYVGFPSRYVERKKWTDSYDKLCAPDKRKWRMNGGRTPRSGLTLWDTIFCFSRDTRHFTRFDEAMFRPGPEHPDQNWAYGDTMVTVGLVETKARFGADPEISMFVLEGAHLGVPAKLNRYVIRLDGFVSRHAPYEERRFVTKPLVFRGSGLRLNFSTSARGRIFLTVRDEKGAELRSAEIFGDKVDRAVGWENGRLADFAGRPVVLDFRMSDADVYSFRFE